MFGINTKSGLSDEEAMQKFQNGDEGSFDLLLGRHGAGVLRFIVRMTGAEKAQAEDLLQEIFMKVIERRKKYDPGQKFSTWLYSIARNHCIDYLRTESYRRHSSLDAPVSVEEEGGAVVIDLVRSGDRDQEERAFVRGDIRYHGVAARHGEEPPEICVQGAPAGIHGVRVFRRKTESERGVKG